MINGGQEGENQMKILEDLAKNYNMAQQNKINDRKRVSTTKLNTLIER